MVGLGDVGVDASRPCQELPRPSEVAALQFHEALIGEGFGEAWVVFQRQLEARVRGFQISALQRLDALGVEIHRLGR